MWLVLKAQVLLFYFKIKEQKLTMFGYKHRQLTWPTKQPFYYMAGLSDKVLIVTAHSV